MSTFLQSVEAPGAATLAPKTKPVAVPKPQTYRPPADTGVRPAPNLEPPDGPPVAALMPYGFYGSIGQFAARAQTVVDAHRAATGASAPPDKVLALAADQSVPHDKLASVSAPYDPAKARAAQALALHPVVTDQQFVAQMRKAAGGDGYRQFLDDNSDRVTELQSDKRWGDKVHGIILARAHQDAVAHKTQTDAASLAEPATLLGRAVGQIVTSLVHSPGGFVKLTEDTALDVSTVAPDVLAGRAPFPRSTKNLEGMAKGTVADFAHPERNAGYLFLDLVGVASLGYGAGLRAAAAGRAVRAGEGVRAAGKALTEKPPLERIQVRLGDYTEEMPLSGNPLVAQMQKRILGDRMSAADRRLSEGPSPLRSILLPGAAEDFVAENLSFERKVGREADARQRVEHIASMSLANQLDAAAGTAIRQHKILGRIPATEKSGLTRGEQKAIQALSWDDPNPLQAERDFHHRMIDMFGEDEGPAFVKNHKVQLSDLDLAEKALENPRSRFAKALQLTRDTVADMERQKIETLGLAPETAEGRVVKAAQVLRGEEPTGGETEFGGHYLPTQPRGKQKRQPSQARGFKPSTGPFGVPPGREMPELSHEFTGSAMRAGDIRIDATSLASEAYARTVRAVTVRNQHQKLWDAGAPTPAGIPEEFQQPIRDVNEIPDELRALTAKMDEGDFTQAEADLLPKDMSDLIRQLYPDTRDLSPQEIEHVRWVDSRILGDALSAPFTPGWGTRVAQAINSPFRILALYLRPAYALNKLGNAAMLVFDQGFMNSIQNLARAHNLEELYGEKNAATIRALTGSGKSRSYVTSSSERFSRGLAEWWNKMTDRNERAASFTYYADRKGYVSADEMDALLNDPAKRGDLVEVTRRSNKALVEFDNLSPIEKNNIRHIIFVYPWVRGATVWSLRAIMEHPAKVAILSHLGRQAIENDPILDRATDWYKRIGYVPLGFNHDGSPRVVNATSINTFSTLEDLLSIGKGATMGDKYASVADMFGPTAKFGIHASTGRDEFGNQYPGSQFWGAAEDVLMGLPQLSHLKAKKNQPLSAFDIRRRDSLEASLNSAIHQTVFTPGWLGGYGSLITGGLTPKGVNRSALEARYWADQDPKVRTARELDLLNRALNMQGDFLKRPVPGDVRQSVRDHANVSLAYAQFNKETGRAPTLKEKADLQLKYLTSKGRVPAADAKKLGNQLKPLTDEQQIRDFQQHLSDTYQAGKQLRQWDSDVRLLYSFQKGTFNAKAPRLHSQGLWAQRVYTGSQDKLDEYGRKYLAFTAEVRKLAADKTSTAADMRLLVDENSKPVDGLPSFAAIAWANQTPEEQAHAIAANTGKGWATLTAVDKQLLGKPVDPAVTEAWTAYQKLTTPEALAKQLPAGQRTLDKAQRLAVVKQIDRYYSLDGKFLRDYTFARSPLYQRLPYLNVVKDSEHKADWRDLLGRAAQLAKAVTDKATTGKAASDAWRDYAAQLPEFYKAERPGFWKELKPVLDANPEFLAGLIRSG